MKSYLYVNDLIKWKSEAKEAITERVLWIDGENLFTFVINIYKKQCVPELKKVEDILYALDSGLAEKTLKDPWENCLQDSEISEKNKVSRDEAWRVISNIVDYKNEPDIFYRKERRKYIIAAAEQFRKSDRVIYKYLTKYWQRGKVINALLPDYENSGGKGKSKTIGEKKLGRPRKNAYHIGQGINVDEDTKKVFRVAINNFYETEKKNTFIDAYRLMLKEYYTEDYIIENGVRKPILISEADIPTLRQFQYWYEKEKNLKQSLTKRKGSKKYALEDRAILGKSDADLMGPGSVYQIDATVADVYLVSRFNRNWIIGRPILYVVIDAFSREVVGIYVGLEGPSWAGAMMALANAFSDKVTFCNEYGLEINEQDWPCHHLPQAILGDRGEFEGKMPETMINPLGIRISNTPSFRADWKGIVEQRFRLVNLKVKPFVPGHIEVDFRERGAKDYRLDAKLDIYQFTQIVIRCMLFYNNKHQISDYEDDKMMIADDITPIPIELWKWGIQKRSGRLRSKPSDITKLYLMPSAKATVRETGIKFKNLHYSCDKAIDEMWFERARNKGSWRVDISYDPRNMDYIYIRSEDGKSFEKCYMLHRKKYGDKTIDEIIYLDEYEQLKKDKRKSKDMQSEVDLISDIDAIVKMAETMTEEQLDHTVSKTSKVKNIRSNRSKEKAANRITEAFELNKDNRDENRDLAEIIPLNKNENTNNLEIPSHIEFLRKKQRERMGRKNEE